MILTAGHRDQRPLHDRRRAAQARTSTRLALAGIDITQDKLFDMSVIGEVYDENPDLKTSPVNPTTPS